MSELSEHVVDDALIRGGGGGQDRGVWQFVDDGTDAAVIRAEIVAPRGNAVCFVNDEHAQTVDEVGQLCFTKQGVVEAFGGDQEDADLAATELRGNGAPLAGVGGGDGIRKARSSGGCGSLAAHG